MKYLIIALLSSPICTLLAQEPGLKNVVGGQINLLSIKGALYDNGEIEPTNQKDAKAKHVDIRPYMAWKLSKHTLIGCRLGFARSQNTYQTTIDNGILGKQKETTIAYSAGIFTRHYLRPAAKLGLFLEPYTGVTKEKYSQRIIGEFSVFKTTYRNFIGQVSPGIAYHITERLGLLLHLGDIGYRNTKNNYDNAANDAYDEFFFNFSLTSFTWGVEYRWGGGKASEPKS